MVEPALFPGPWALGAGIKVPHGSEQFCSSVVSEEPRSVLAGPTVLILPLRGIHKDGGGAHCLGFLEPSPF